MTKTKAKQLAQEKMSEWNIEGWKLDFNRRKSSFGLCSYKKKTIFLSIYYLSVASDEQVLDTILHEIAHILTGPGEGHNWKWKRMARIVGANPVRCEKSPEGMPKGKWQAICSNHGILGHYHRKPKTGKRRGIPVCIKCDSRIYFVHADSGEEVHLGRPMPA